MKHSTTALLNDEAGQWQNPSTDKIYFSRTSEPGSSYFVGKGEQIEIHSLDAGGSPQSAILPAGLALKLIFDGLTKIREN